MVRFDLFIAIHFYLQPDQEIALMKLISLST